MKITRTLATLGGAALLAGGLVAQAVPASAQVTHHCHTGTAMHYLDSVTSWRYVGTRLANELNVPCLSKLMGGTDSAFVMLPKGIAVDPS